MKRRRFADIAQRKALLVSRTALQRSLIAVSAAELERPLAVVDRGIAAARYLKARPQLLAALVAGGLLISRFKLLRWVGPGLVAWRTWRSITGWSRRPPSRPLPAPRISEPPL